MKPPKLPELQNFIPKDTPLVEPAENAHIGLSVPEVVFTYGKLSNHVQNVPHILPNMVKAMLNVQKSYRSLQHNPASGKKRAGSTFFQELEAYAHALGCDDIGYTEVPQALYFQKQKDPFPPRHCCDDGHEKI